MLQESSDRSHKVLALWTMLVLAMVLLLFGMLAILGGKPASAQSDPGGAPSGSGEDPIFVQGNPSCATLPDTMLPGSHYEFKINNVSENKTYTDTVNSTGFQVTISNSDGTYFDFQTLPSMGVDAVIVKGDDNADAYVYNLDQESTGDTRLHAPVNPNNGKLYGISHVSFCYDLDSANADPIAANDSYTTDENQPLTVGAANGVLANDTDPDNDTLSVTGNTQPQHGSVTVNANGSFTYTPNANYNGPDSFNYTVSDGKGGTATGTVNITVDPVDDAPVIERIEYGNAVSNGSVDGGPVNEGSPATIIVTASDPDTPNNALSYSFDCDNDGTFEKGPQQSNTTTCTYPDDGIYPVNVKVTDDTQLSDFASKDVEVVNVAPVLTIAADQAANEGTGKDFELGSFTDPGDDASWNVTVDWGDGSQNTTFESASPGNLPQKPHTYADDGSYTVMVTVAEAGQNAPSDTKTFTVNVANVRPTVALSGPNTADEGDTKTYTFTVADPGDDEQTIDWDCGANGEKVGGSFSYDPATKTGSFECRFPDGPAQTNVSVTVGDGDGNSSDSIAVNVANVAPTANDDQMNTTELQEVTTNLLDNDSDPGNDLDAASLRILNTGGPNDGAVTIGELLDGNVTYKPNRGFIGGDSFRYEICDDDGDCSSASVQVSVGPVDCNAQGVIRGTQRADILRGTPGDDIICAFGGKDTIYGGGDDLLIGDSGDDQMWGQDGSDVMRGGANTDAMDGGLGEDYMTGDSGRDVMLGRGGSDFLDLLDGSGGDAGNGGAGTDTCAKDSGDRTVSCERRQ